MPRYEQMRSSSSARNYENQLRQQHPSIHYVASSFDRSGLPPAQPCRDSCCISPSPMRNGYRDASRSKSRQRHQSSLLRQMSSDQKPLTATKGGPAGKTPETFYINTITNNYYQIKRKNGQIVNKNEVAGQLKSLPEIQQTPRSSKMSAA